MVVSVSCSVLLVQLLLLLLLPLPGLTGIARLTGPPILLVTTAAIGQLEQIQDCTMLKMGR